jgi:hypothetical protein
MLLLPAALFHAARLHLPADFGTDLQEPDMPARRRSTDEGRVVMSSNVPQHTHGFLVIVILILWVSSCAQRTELDIQAGKIRQLEQASHER